MTKVKAIEIKSWMFRTRHHKGNPEELVPSDRFTEIEYNHIDWNYPEGALTISYYGNYILDKGHWDIMDQLWFQFLNSAENYKENGTASFFYPDSSINIGLSKPYNNAVILTVNENKTVLDEAEFFTELYSAGHSFFTALRQIPHRTNGYIQEALNILYKAGYPVD